MQYTFNNRHWIVMAWAVCSFLVACREGGDAAGQTADSETAEPISAEQSFFSDYMGQELPGLEPVVFAPGLISTDRTEIGFEMSPDGREIYFVRFEHNVPRIYFTRSTDSGWSTPAPVPSIGNEYSTHPSLSSDGNVMFFSSKRPLPADWRGARPTPDSREAIVVWRAAREGTEWGQPYPVSFPVGERIADASVSANGTIYASGIIRAVFEDGNYSVPERLIPHLEGQWPYVAPDESFIVFGQGFPRFLLVSFQNVDGTWSGPRIVGDGLGFEGAEMNGMPYVTPDRRFLFFTANHNIYWVDARVLAL